LFPLTLQGLIGSRDFLVRSLDSGEEEALRHSMMDPEILSASQQHPTDASCFRSQAHQTAAVGAAALKLGRSYHALTAKAQPQAAHIAPRFLAPWTQSRRCLPPSPLPLPLSPSYV
jgi:hypothetical protein